MLRMRMIFSPNRSHFGGSCARKHTSGGQDETLSRHVTHSSAARRPTRGRACAGAVWLVAVLTTGFFIPPAIAEAVPIPQPAPKDRGGAPAAKLHETVEPEVTGTTQPPEPIIPDRRRNVPANFFA